MLRSVALFAVLFAASTGQMLLWDSTSALDLVSSLQRLYHARCVFLVASERSWMTMGPRVVLTQKMLSVQGVFTAPLGLRDLKRPQRCRANPPLNVVFGSEKDTLEYLRGLDRVPSHPRWVAFLDGDIDAFLRGVNVEFDCVFLAVRAQIGAQTGAQTGAQKGAVSAVYRVQRNASLLVEHLADLTPERGLGAVRREFGAQRSDLHGVKMRVCLINAPPLFLAVQTSGAPIAFEGFFGAAWRLLEKELNFTSEFLMSPSGLSSGLLANGSWTGCMAAIQQGLADASMSDVTMTIDRSSLVYHLYPTFTTYNRYYIEEPTAVNLSWDNFLSPFMPRLWLAVAASVALLSLTLLAAHRCALRLGIEQPEDATDFSRAIVYVFGLTCGQGHETTPNTASGRIIHQVAAMSGIIVVAAYAAALISFLTVEIKAFPVNSFEDLLLPNGRYKLGVPVSSGVFTLFQTSGDPVLRQVYAKLVQPTVSTLPRSDADGLLRVCTDPYYGHITYPEKTNGGKGLPCRIAPAPGIFLPVRFAVAIFKELPFRHALNARMLQFLHSGALRGIRRKFLPDSFPAEKSDIDLVSIEQTTPILVVFASGLCVAGVLLLLERSASLRARRGRVVAGRGRGVWTSSPGMALRATNKGPARA